MNAEAGPCFFHPITGLQLQYFLSGVSRAKIRLENLMNMLDIQFENNTKTDGKTALVYDSFPILHLTGLVQNFPRKDIFLQIKTALKPLFANLAESQLQFMQSSAEAEVHRLFSRGKSYSS